MHKNQELSHRSLSFLNPIPDILEALIKQVGLNAKSFKKSPCFVPKILGKPLEKSKLSKENSKGFHCPILESGTTVIPL